LLIINNSCWPCPRWWRRADWPYLLYYSELSVANLC